MARPAPERGAAPLMAVVPSRRALFAAFFKVGALGFGGVAALARHVLVTERGLLDERGFADAFGVASALPGANTVNLATMLGDRHHGPSGALAAVLGLMSAPLGIVVAAASLYARFGDNGDVRAALVGAAAAAAGLVTGTSLRILKGMEPDAATVAIAALVCLAASVLRTPMLLTLAVAVPASAGLALLRRPRRRP